MNRLLLSEKLHAICENVYFQPPSGFQLKYPCIIYERSNGNSIYADDATYRYTQRYTVTCIDPNPDSELPEKVAMLPCCRPDRYFTADNLNHYVFSLHF